MKKKKELIKTNMGIYFIKNKVKKINDEFHCNKCGVKLDEFISTLAMTENSVYCKNDHFIGLSEYIEKRWENK